MGNELKTLTEEEMERMAAVLIASGFMRKEKLIPLLSDRSRTKSAKSPLTCEVQIN